MSYARSLLDSGPRAFDVDAGMLATSIDALSDCAQGLHLESQKQRAAERAVAWVESGMVVGLGAGSTAAYAVRAIAALVGQGRLHDVVGIPCSSAVEAAAHRLGIPLTSLEECEAIDLTIDGADEVDPDLNLIKGGGGALLHEKIVAQASRREVIVVDASKPSPRLGTRRPLPGEVVRFGWGSERRFLESLGAQVSVRQTRRGQPFRTDQGNLILDCAFGPIADPKALAGELDGRAGVVGHGLFLGLATDLLVASEHGVEHATRPRHG
jgi:ribose 5-phosphate isomerase A